MGAAAGLLFGTSAAITVFSGGLSSAALEVSTDVLLLKIGCGLTVLDKETIGWFWLKLHRADELSVWSPLLVGFIVGGNKGLNDDEVKMDESVR